MLRYLDDYESISIHSLARGRTTSAGKCVNVSFDFNPLPRKRENCYGLPKRNRAKNFNPLPRKRENHTTLRMRAKRKISIHSLARGRTECCGYSESGVKFQSTPSQEGEHYTDIRIFTSKPFQSTPSQEGERQCRQQ